MRLYIYSVLQLCLRITIFKFIALHFKQVWVNDDREPCICSKAHRRVMYPRMLRRRWMELFRSHPNDPNLFAKFTRNWKANPCESQPGVGSMWVSGSGGRVLSIESTTFAMSSIGETEKIRLVPWSLDEVPLFHPFWQERSKIRHVMTCLYLSIISTSEMLIILISKYHAWWMVEHLEACYFVHGHSPDVRCKY